MVKSLLCSRWAVEPVQTDFSEQIEVKGGPVKGNISRSGTEDIVCFQTAEVKSEGDWVLNIIQNFKQDLPSEPKLLHFL